MRDIVLLLVCMVIVYSVGIIGSIYTTDTVNSTWYDSIKPAITPPNWVFMAVWNTLFFLIGLSLFIGLRNADRNTRVKIIVAFGVNLFLNALWSFIYFGLRRPGVAFIELIFLWVSIILMIVVVKKSSRISGWLLVPYLLWVSFASILNYLSI